jgi:hypothetical protein
MSSAVYRGEPMAKQHTACSELERQRRGDPDVVAGYERSRRAFERGEQVRELQTRASLTQGKLSATTGPITHNRCSQAYHEGVKGNAVADASPGAVYYEVWENRSGNLLAEFDTEAEALQFVRDAVTAGDLVAMLSWSLHRSDTATPVAHGTALYALVDQRLPV